MMKNEKQVNEAVENEVLEAEVVDGQPLKKAKTKKQGRVKQFAEAHPVFTGVLKTVGAVAGGFVLGILVGGKGGNDSGSEDYPSEEPAYLPSGEDTEI